MKVSCTLLSSVVAASTIAISSSSSNGAQGFASESRKSGGCGSGTSLEKEKFAPRFDGLRFIETLVTAHR